MPCCRLSVTRGNKLFLLVVPDGGWTVAGRGSRMLGAVVQRRNDVDFTESARLSPGGNYCFWGPDISFISFLSPGCKALPPLIPVESLVCLMFHTSITTARGRAEMRPYYTVYCIVLYFPQEARSIAASSTIRKNVVADASRCTRMPSLDQYVSGLPVLHTRVVAAVILGSGTSSIEEEKKVEGGIKIIPWSVLWCVHADRVVVSFWG